MYEIELKAIRFSNGKRHQFATEIVEALDFEEAIVVRLASAQPVVSQNIFGLDYQGNLMWKIPSARSFDARSPYISLSRNGSFVEAVNWDGHIVTLHPKLGYIVSEEVDTGGSFLSRRAPSSREWL